MDRLILLHFFAWLVSFNEKRKKPFYFDSSNQNILDFKNFAFVV